MYHALHWRVSKINSNTQVSQSDGLLSNKNGEVFRMTLSRLAEQYGHHMTEPYLQPLTAQHLGFSNETRSISNPSRSV